jgi:hypothetical protein
MIRTSSSRSASWFGRILESNRRRSSSNGGAGASSKSYRVEANGLSGAVACSLVGGGAVVLFCRTNNDNTTGAAAAIVRDGSASIHKNRQRQQIARRKPTVFPSIRFLRGVSVLNHQVNTVRCDAYLYMDHDDLEDDMLDSSGYTESERFYQCLEYHRALRNDYHRRWTEGPESHAPSWPLNIPKASDIPALELDLRFCERSPSYRDQQGRCQDQQFRIASYYVTQNESVEDQKKGFKLVKELAEHGHPNGMCLYGTYWHEMNVNLMKCREYGAFVRSCHIFSTSRRYSTLSQHVSLVECMLSNFQT